MRKNEEDDDESECMCFAAESGWLSLRLMFRMAGNPMLQQQCYPTSGDRKPVPPVASNPFKGTVVHSVRTGTMSYYLTKRWV